MQTVALALILIPRYRAISAAARRAAAADISGAVTRSVSRVSRLAMIPPAAREYIGSLAQAPRQALARGRDAVTDAIARGSGDLHNFLQVRARRRAGRWSAA